MQHRPNSFRRSAKPTAIYTVVTARGEVYGGKTVNPGPRAAKHRRTWPGSDAVKGRKQTPEWVAKRMASTAATKAVRKNENIQT